MGRQLLTLVVVAAVVVVPALAQATEELTEVIESEWDTQGPPACWVCHTGDVRTRYTITTPFGQALKARGMTAEDEDALRHALQALEAEHVDSDRDGITDHDELQDGTDPNLPEGEDRPTQVAYGCFGQLAGGRLATGGLAALLPLLISFIVQRRSRPRPGGST